MPFSDVPTLNSWKAVTSTYHLMIKFPTDYEVGELQGNQVTARECYIAIHYLSCHYMPTGMCTTDPFMNLMYDLLGLVSIDRKSVV